MKVPPTPTEVWEARTGEIKPECCGHVVKVRDAAGQLVGRIIKGKPTPTEKVRTSLAKRKQRARAARAIAKQRGEKVGRRRGGLIVGPCLFEHTRAFARIARRLESP